MRDTTRKKGFVRSVKLKEGKTYNLVFHESEEDRKKKPVQKRMKLIKCYRHHAVFENKIGIRTSFQYWDIERMLSGEPR